MQAVEFLAGLALVCATLVDVFGSVIMPGRLRRPFALARRLRKLSHPLWLRWSRPGARSGPQLGALHRNAYAPLLLIGAFVGWIGMLIVGYGLMFHALADRFTPTVPTLPEGIFLAGSALLTLGLEHARPEGAARWAALAAGLSGLSVLTATLTFILSVQTALHQRETLVRRLPARAGLPPSGVRLLETYAALDLHDRLGDFFESWESWTAAVSHNHAAWPVLAYYRSEDPRGDWIAALGAVLDAAALTCGFLADGPRGQAFLLLRTGSRAAEGLCRELEIEPGEPAPLDDAALRAAHQRLQAAGWRLDAPATAIGRCSALRRDYAGHIAALVEHFGVAPAAWPAPEDQAAAAAASATARIR